MTRRLNDGAVAEACNISPSVVSSFMRGARKVAPKRANGSSSAIINCDNYSRRDNYETHGSDNPKVRICFRRCKLSFGIIGTPCRRHA